MANSATLSLMVKDDPRDLSTMTYSDNQFRHKVVFYGTLPSIWGFFDLHLAKEVRLFGIHKVEGSIDFFNLANMFNKNWGVGNNLGKQNLYSIKSFDAAKQEYVYNMSSNVGVSNLNGNPFQIQLGLRYAF